jgi:hypothetical protein
MIRQSGLDALAQSSRVTPIDVAASHLSAPFFERLAVNKTVDDLTIGLARRGYPTAPFRGSSRCS